MAKAMIHIEAYCGDFVGEDRLVGLSRAGRIHEYDLSNGQEVNRAEGMKYGTAVRVSPDGERLAVTTSDNQLALFQRDGSPLLRRRIESEIYRGVAWSPNSMRFAMAHHRSHLALHDAVSGEEIAQIPCERSGTVERAGENLLLIDHVMTDDMVPRLQVFDWNLNPVSDELILPIGADLVCRDREVSRIGVVVSRSVWIYDSSLTSHRELPSPEGSLIRSVQMHPAGTEVAIVSDEGDVYRMDTSSGEVLWTARCELASWCGYSPLGTRLITFSPAKSLVADVSR